MSQSRVCLLIILALLLSAAICGAQSQPDPIKFTPHPQAGHFKLKRDADKPILAFYGGIGLRRMPDGRWNGYGQTSEEDVKYLIRRMAENGMGRVYASFQEEEYPSRVAPGPPPGTPDYIKLFCELAHQNNIEVYGDIACFANVIAKCRDFTAAHPDLFTRDAAGALDEHMLSPAYPEVRRFKRALLMEYVQNYPIDGLALDFIRYPYYGRDIRSGFGKHGYDAPTLDLFRQRFGYDSSYLPAIDDPRWIAIKAGQINQFIAEVRADLAAAGVSIPLAAFNSGVYGRADSYRTVHQDWLAWETQKLIDEHCPMILMAHGMTHLVGATRDLVRIKRPGSLVMGPIFLDANTDPATGKPFGPQRVRDAARRLIKLGCDGLWFCRASEIEELGLWPVVKEISQWSISQIRAEEFDPAYENLLTNGGFEQGLAGWRLSIDRPPTTSPTGLVKGSVNVQLSSESPIIMEQQLHFVTPPYLAVESLGMSATIDATNAKPEKPVQLQMLLHYADGKEETITRSAGARPPGPGRLESIIKVASDFDKHVLEWAQASIILPAGSGSITIDQCEVVRDPLLEGHR